MISIASSGHMSHDTKQYPGKVSPENNIDCPFGELGLVDIVDKK